MPCESGPSYDPSGDLDKVTRILCGVLRKLSDYEISPNKLLDAEGQEWWQEHQAQDARREAAERAAQEREQRRQDALAKLSPEEKSLLGLRLSFQPS